VKVHENLNCRCPYPDCADDPEYRMSGECGNCHTSVTGTFTTGHRKLSSACPKWKDKKYAADSAISATAGPEPKRANPVCPRCGCDPIYWKKLV
jgi:hypothetical protein